MQFSKKTFLFIWYHTEFLLYCETQKQQTNNTNNNSNEHYNGHGGGKTTKQKKDQKATSIS